MPSAPTRSNVTFSSPSGAVSNAHTGTRRGVFFAASAATSTTTRAPGRKTSRVAGSIVPQRRAASTVKRISDAAWPTVFETTRDAAATTPVPESATTPVPSRPRMRFFAVVNEPPETASTPRASWYCWRTSPFACQRKRSFVVAPPR